MSTYVSSGALRERDVKGAIARCQSAGISHLELASGLKCPPEQWPLVKAAAADGMSFLLHNYFPAPDTPFVLNLAALDAENLNRSLALCRTAIDWSAQINAPFYSIHAGFAMALGPKDLGNPGALRKKTAPNEQQRARAMEQFNNSVRQIADYAAQKNVRLLLENNVVANGSFEPGTHHGLLLVEADEITEFFGHLDHDNVGLLVDVAHAKVSAHSLGFDHGEWLASVLPFAGAFHLSENDGLVDSNKPFDEHAWFADILQQSKKLPCVIEVYNIDNQQIDDLTNCISQMKK